MMRGVDKNHKISERNYRKVLNLKDPFDRLIMDLSNQGVLDIGVVGVRPGKTVTYSRRQGNLRGRHTI